MAPSSVAQALALLCAAGVLFFSASASPLGVSPRLDLPQGTSIGVAPRTHWVDDERVAAREAVAAAAAPASGTKVRAVLEVVVPTASTAARVVCVAGASGCASTTPSTSTSGLGLGDDDDGPPVIVGSDDALTRDDDDGPALREGGGGDGAQHGSKVFFVDEDSDEEAIKDRKKDKKKDKKTVGVPIILSYDGWKGKTEDDIPIDPDRRRHYNINYDMQHDYSGLSAPAHFAITPRPLYKTVRTSDVPVTFWDVPLGSETLLVHRLVKSTPLGNAIYPTPSPSYWRPPYVNSGTQWSRGPSNGYPGGYRTAINKRTFQPTPPAPGFYGGVHPRVYPPSPGPTSSVWCPPRSPGWPPSRPLYPTPTTTTRPVLNVKDKLDFENSEEDSKGDGDKKTPSRGEVKIIGKIELDDFRK